MQTSTLWPKTINCCIGVTRPTLKLGPTLDIFIIILIKKKGEKRSNKTKRLETVLLQN